MASYHAVVEDLVKLIAENHWEGAFAEAIKRAQEKNVPLIKGITNLRVHHKMGTKIAQAYPAV